MAGTTTKGAARWKRKQIFSHDGLRLWLDTEGHGTETKPVLELERLKPRTRTVWEQVWRGVVKTNSYGLATVVTKRLRGSK